MNGVRDARMSQNSRPRINAPDFVVVDCACLERVDFQNAARLLDQRGWKAIFQLARSLQIPNDVYLVDLPLFGLRALHRMVLHVGDLLFPAVRVRFFVQQKPANGFW